MSDELTQRAREVADRFLDGSAYYDVVTRTKGRDTWQTLDYPEFVAAREKLGQQLQSAVADFARAEVKRERDELADRFDAASRQLAIMRSMDATIGARTYEDARNIVLARSTTK